MTRRRSAGDSVQVLVAALLVVAMAYLVAHIAGYVLFPPEPRRPMICLDSAMTVGCEPMVPNPDRDFVPG